MSHTLTRTLDRQNSDSYHPGSDPRMQLTQVGQPRRDRRGFSSDSVCGACGAKAYYPTTIIWNAETYEELLRRWINAPARLLDPDTYNICDIDGHPIAAVSAFADSLVSSLRRVVQDAVGVTINMGTPTRLFSGLARLGVILATTECYRRRSLRSLNEFLAQGARNSLVRTVEHSAQTAAAKQGGLRRGGPTDQLNGLPACPRHNWLKERGYTVTRHQDGTITITTPTGDTVQ
jgi:hypothetical protein